MCFEDHFDHHIRIKRLVKLATPRSRIILEDCCYIIIFNNVLDQRLINIVDKQVLFIVSIQLAKTNLPHDFVDDCNFWAIYLVSKSVAERHVHEIINIVQNQGITV